MRIIAIATCHYLQLEGSFYTYIRADMSHAHWLIKLAELGNIALTISIDVYVVADS